MLLLFDINGVLMQHRWDGASHQVGCLGQAAGADGRARLLLLPPRRGGVTEGP